MNKVYVVNDTYHDFSVASEYGEVLKVTTGKIPVFKDDTIICMLKEGLKDFKQDDYLLLAGPMTANIYAVNVLATKYTDFKMLVFDAKEQAYKVRHFSKSKFN